MLVHHETFVFHLKCSDGVESNKLMVTLSSSKPGARPAVFTHLTVFAVLDVLLPVQEPVWDFVLARILHDGHHTLHLDKPQTAVYPHEHK